MGRGRMDKNGLFGLWFGIWTLTGIGMAIGYLGGAIPGWELPVWALSFFPIGFLIQGQDVLRALVSIRR